jgi:hypothetical protein
LSLSLRFFPQNPVHTSPLPHKRYMPRPSDSSRFYNPQNSEEYRWWSSSLWSFLHSPLTSSLLDSSIFTAGAKNCIHILINLININC